MSHLEIYSKISNLFDIKFKRQINNIELEFVNLFLTKSLISEYQFYVILFDDKKIIEFENKEDFLDEFSNYIKYRILNLENELKNLSNTQNLSIKVDQNYIFLEHERIYSSIDKFDKLLEKIKKLK